MPRSYRGHGLRVAWDEPRLVAAAGLLAPATLAQRLGLVKLFDRRVDLGPGAGGAHVWPWAGAIQAALARLQALPMPLRA